MFRFFRAESKGSEKTVDSCQQTPDPDKPQHPTLDTTATLNSDCTPLISRKRRRSLVGSSHATPNRQPSAKRARWEKDDAVASHLEGDSAHASFSVTDDMERARDAIHYQLGLEILLKHNELRLINQELAKCQVALEQLRRCHLIPYPVSCPTPDQMVAISNGKGPALQGRPGERVPQWAPPFGVVDGPYARHYAKWLIPDPMFDGVQSEWQFMPEPARSRASLEGRTTRNSFAEAGGFVPKRPVRGMSGQKLQALSSGYPQPKEKNGPCVLKRAADGLMVKLVCIDCQRDNFSSTQGFINHCRIAHRRDFKSHEEAAIACGHPIDVDDGGSILGDEKSTASPSQASGLVHPFARTDMTDQQAYRALQSRIRDSLKLYHEGKLPGVTSIPTIASASQPTKTSHQQAGNFTSSAEAPYLSSLLERRNFTGNLNDLVSEAKKQDIAEALSSPGEESEDGLENLDRAKDAHVATRAPVIMRMPARTMSPAPLVTTARPTSSKSRSPHMGFASPPLSAVSIVGKDDSSRPLILHDDDLDADLSPNTLVSNNAPSLVSDDGEYDDSDDGSSESDASESLEAESVSDVAEINIDEDHEPARSLRHHRGPAGVGSGTAVRLRKEDNKHVTFVSPVKNNAKERRGRKV
jgi:ADA HAT complex component 1